MPKLVDLPNEDIAIKKALARLGANSIGDCELTVDGYCDIADEWREKIKAIENTKDIYGLNNLLKTEDIRIKQEQPVSIFNKEVIKRLSGEGYDVTADGEWLTVALNGNPVAKINDSDIVYTDGDFYDKDKSGTLLLVLGRVFPIFILLVRMELAQCLVITKTKERTELLMIRRFI